MDQNDPIMIYELKLQGPQFLLGDQRCMICRVVKMAYNSRFFNFNLAQEMIATIRYISLTYPQDDFFLSEDKQ